MENKDDLNKLHNNFIQKLEQHYGKFDSVNNKFESTSNSIIARDLFYSDSQFSRLTHNTASEGELRRALGNVERLLKIDKLRLSANNMNDGINKKWIILPIVLILALAVFCYIEHQPNKSDNLLKKDSRFEMLKWGFENNYIQPYVKLKELPEDCYYPCYKYQGKWNLKNEYKIPFYRERNGFHYVAKEVVMYARCMDERQDRGESFEGYEYQKHELWYDVREFPMDSFLIKNSNSELRKSYLDSNFDKDPNFIKIAYVHTFFRTEFKIDSALIFRKGKAIGRDIEFIEDKILSKKVGSVLLLNELKDEIKAIAKNRLEDFSKPISCGPIIAPKTDFNDIEEGNEMSFNCQFTTGRFLVNYNKIYVFEDQYINNYCR